MDLILLKDALHHASPEEAGRDTSLRERTTNVAFGRGVLVGLVSGLMVSGKSFDEAWQLCLAQGCPLLPDCIPPAWPGGGGGPITRPLAIP